MKQRSNMAGTVTRKASFFIRLVQEGPQQHSRQGIEIVWGSDYQSLNSMKSLLGSTFKKSGVANVEISMSCYCTQFIVVYVPLVWPCFTFNPTGY